MHTEHLLTTITRDIDTSGLVIHWRSAMVKSEVIYERFWVLTVYNTYTIST